MVTRHSSTSRRMGFASLIAGVAAGMIAAPAAGQDARPKSDPDLFTGHWKIASAVTAPWASDPTNKADTAEAKRLLGKELIIGKTLFQGPAPLGCAKPSFVIRDETPDMVFEGSLSADGANKPTDPIAVARSLGIDQTKVRGMTASCSEVEFLYLDFNKIMFGLNNRIFTARREK